MVSDPSSIDSPSQQEPLETLFRKIRNREYSLGELEKEFLQESQPRANEQHFSDISVDGWSDEEPRSESRTMFYNFVAVREQGVTLAHQKSTPNKVKVIKFAAVSKYANRLNCSRLKNALCFLHIYQNNRVHYPKNQQFGFPKRFERPNRDSVILASHGCC
jgi:hypothetical protein